MKLLVIGGLLLVACSLANSPPVNQSCVTYQEFEVRGHSMAGVYEAGDTITVAIGYLDCNNITSNTIVLASTAANDNPVLKRAVGIPGDSWGLDGKRIIINGEPARTTNKEEYTITNKGLQMLRLYAEDYPTLEKEYLLLGNQPSGTLDATSFGLVARENIIGVVIQ